MLTNRFSLEAAIRKATHDQFPSPTGIRSVWQHIRIEWVFRDLDSEEREPPYMIFQMDVPIPNKHNDCYVVFNILASPGQHHDKDLTRRDWLLAFGLYEFKGWGLDAPQPLDKRLRKDGPQLMEQAVEGLRDYRARHEAFVE